MINPTMKNAESPAEKPNAPAGAKEPVTPEELGALRAKIANMEKYFRESSADEKEKAPDYLPYLNAATLTEDDLKTGVLLEKWRAENGRLAGEKSREFLDFFRARWRGVEEDLRREIKESLKKTAGEEADEDFLEAQMAEKLEEDPRYNFYLYLNRKIEEKIKNGEK